jgi:hypothetical protein
VNANGHTGEGAGSRHSFLQRGARQQGPVVSAAGFPSPSDFFPLPRECPWTKTGPAAGKSLRSARQERLQRRPGLVVLRKVGLGLFPRL